MSSISDSKYKVKFLNDIPESSDEIGIHEEIAKVIQNIINNEGLKSSKKKIIGLFGSWGSGKSTVIEMLKNLKDKNSGDTKYNIFVFDSWSHKGDFLKRAFLIELARHLKVLNEEYPEDGRQQGEKLLIKDILSSKIIHRNVNLKPKSELDKWTKGITVLILLSLIISLLASLIQAIFPKLFKLFSFLLSISIPWLLIVGVIFLVVAAALKLRNLNKEFDKGIERFVTFYLMKKINLTETYITREDIEFTSYDYENYLKKVLSVAGKKKLNHMKALIIVFDNLDRVDDETIVNTLSLIQLTIEIIERNQEFNKNLEKENVLENLYFIVPIDKGRLLKTIENGIFKGKVDKNFAEEFLKKIFPYEVNIPEIKHSNWRAFFDKMFKEAFEPSDKDNNELGEKLLFIRRIFEESIRSSRNNLTPREIKNFINSLVSNYLFWEDRIGIELQALYVASRNYLPKELRTYILTELEKEKEKSNTENEQKKLEQLIEIAKKEFNEDQVKEALLKQYYGVEEIYTLFVDKMIIAIRKKDIKEINQIFSMFKDRNKIERLVRCIWERADEYRDSINSLLSLSYCLRQSDLSEDFIFNDFYEKEIIPAFQEQMSDLEKLADLESTILEELIRIVQENSNLKKLLIENSAEIIISYGSENGKG